MKVAWSIGRGDFFNVGDGKKDLGNNQPIDLALLGTLGEVPNTFFDSPALTLLDQRFFENEKQQADERIGDVNCYVFCRDIQGGTRTLWIGKVDFLIHQIRREENVKEEQAQLDDLAKKYPQIANLSGHTIIRPNNTTIETHTNIVLNQKFLPANFGD
jgi:hypothetical protein